MKSLIICIYSLLIISTNALHNINEYFNHFDLVRPLSSGKLLKREYPFNFNVNYKGLDLVLVLRPHENFVHPSVVRENDIDVSKFYTGHIQNVPNSVVRLVYHENLFEGVLNFGDINFDDLILEPVSRYAHKNEHSGKMVLYRRADVNSRFQTTKFAHNLRKRQAKNQISITELKALLQSVLDEMENGSSRTPVSSIPPAPVATTTKAPVVAAAAPTAQSTPPQNTRANKVCKMAVVADQSFFQAHASENAGYNNFLVGLINEASLSYEKQLGTQLRVDKILTTQPGQQDPCKISAIPKDALAAIKKVNAISTCLKLEDFCVVMVISSIDLIGDTIGIANIGRICTDGSNTGLAVDSNAGRKLARAELVGVIAHETGHLFNADHDSPGGRCDPGGSSRFLMFPSIQRSSANGIKFSPCSLESINQLMSQNRIKQCLAR